MPAITLTRAGARRLILGRQGLWPVYVPAPQRKYGYYALPILWDDGFVGRSDLKFERASNTLIVCGIWFEDRKTAANLAFNDATHTGLRSFHAVSWCDEGRRQRGRAAIDAKATFVAERREQYKKPVRWTAKLDDCSRSTRYDRTPWR
jgi:Winged helix DNA-binding domain